MNIPAISQVIEQFIRVAIIMIAIVMFTSQSWSIYRAGTLAIVGSGIGFFASSLFLMQRKPLSYLKHMPMWKWLGKVNVRYRCVRGKPINCYCMASRG